MLCVGMVKFFNLPVIWVCVIGFFLDGRVLERAGVLLHSLEKESTARLTDKVIAKAVAENNEVEMKTMKGQSAENEAVNVHGDSVISVPPQENGVSVPHQENAIADASQEEWSFCSSRECNCDASQGECCLHASSGNGRLAYVCSRQGLPRTRNSAIKD